MLNMNRADIGDHRDVRLCNRSQIGDLTEMVHTHFQDSDFRILRNCQNCHGHTDVIVVIFRCLCHPIGAAQHRSYHFLGGAFAHRAGDAQPIPFAAGDLTQRQPGILHHDCRVIPVVMGAQHRRSTFVQCSGNKVMPIPLALQGNKQLSGFQLSAVIVRAEKSDILIFGIDPAAAPKGSLL